ncbi:ABC transporter permease [Streptomyces sp. SPB162]|uniref:FtsX-like permease family protein n=1 Tax=Streptomyces sp. SPB162 TaxID=2940560 RepID=UPI00240582AB|nr:ABC transporter permease [Streptomyces sp. SPB162]MDF9816276.1 putative ABC transport system permease protein [Streptomyces sp. SPB162]
MFVALRDIRFAKGRFALMGVVVTLITTLVVFLSGLTGGLGRDASSAVDELPVSDIVFGAPAGAAAEVSFSSSTISAAQAAAWANVLGVGSAQPLGVAMTRASGAAAAGSVSLFGGSADLLPPLLSGTAPRDGQVAVSESVANTYGVGPGGTLGLGTERLTVSGITATRSYGHAATVWTTLATWQRVSGQRQPTVLALRHPGADHGAVDAAQGTRAVGRGDALVGIDGYQAEHLSLQLIQVFLFAVSALVTGAFFTVWTVQRKPDVAVLKALGASGGYLVRDALAQALAVLGGGALLGGAIGAGGGAVAASAVPFAVGPATVAVPVAVMVLLGLAGSALAIFRITSVDPLTALGANR